MISGFKGVFFIVDKLKIKLRYIISSLLVLMLTITIIPAQGSSLYDEQRQTQQKIQETERALKEKEAERQRALKELNQLNSSINKTTNEIELLDKKIVILEQSIAKAEKDIEEKEIEVNERSDIFAERFKQSYQVGQVSYLEILFQSSSFSDFLTRFEFLKRLIDNDNQLLAELQAEREALEKKKQELLVSQQNMIKTKVQQEQKKEQLQIASNRSQELVRQLERDKASYQKALDDLERESKLIEEEIRRLQSKGGTKPSKLSWPTPGFTRVTSNYGSRVHPITRVKSFHTGIDIAASQGSNLHAAASGKVLFAGWRGAYGNAIIIDHGGSMSTFYGHLSAISVKAGQEVKMNEVIGKIGSTGWSTGPHLHFEVRLDGEHTNPRSYLGI